MDPWELFSELCRQVVEEQNVHLDVTIIGNNIQMMLMPIDCYDDDYEEGDDE